MTHSDLIERAKAFLRGQGCNPVYAGNAGCAEIPDAIGWSHRWSINGSIVVECKVSVEDFLRDKRKPYIKLGNGRMGDFRYFLCPKGVLGGELVEKHFSDHGLLYPNGRGCKIVRVAPCRLHPNRKGEIRYLRQAIVHIQNNLSASGVKFDPCQLAKWASSSALESQPA